MKKYFSIKRCPSCKKIIRIEKESEIQFIKTTTTLAMNYGYLQKDIRYEKETLGYTTGIWCPKCKAKIFIQSMVYINQKIKKCPDCKGRGKIDVENIERETYDCDSCKGSGQTKIKPKPSKKIYAPTTKCDKCEGEGRLYKTEDGELIMVPPYI